LSLQFERIRILKKRAALLLQMDEIISEKETKFLITASQGIRQAITLILSHP
jgi:hypothetical protein